MGKMSPAEWIRIFHRWSGIGLILFVGLKIISGFTMAGTFHLFNAESASHLHMTRWVDVPLLFLFIFHASYGILKIAMSKGVQNKARALILTNIFAGILLLAILFFMVR